MPDPQRPKDFPVNDPWKRLSLREVFHEAARLYVRSWNEFFLPLIGLLGLGFTAGIAAGWWSKAQSWAADDAAAVAVGAMAALFVFLLFTPFGIAAAIHILLRRWGGVEARISRIRYYRLVGIFAYLVIPSAVLFGAFPLGLLAVVFFAWWLFAPHAVLIEGDGGRTAMRRSRMLSTGEFSATALPLLMTFSLVVIALFAAHRLIVSPPQGWTWNTEGAGFVRPLQQGESFDPSTGFLKAPDGRVTPVPDAATFDTSKNRLELPPPEPVPFGTALLWAGIPTLLAGFAEPFRWFVATLLYWNLRIRREGWSPELLVEELRDGNDDDGHPSESR